MMRQKKRALGAFELSTGSPDLPSLGHSVERTLGAAPFPTERTHHLALLAPQRFRRTQ